MGKIVKQKNKEADKSQLVWIKKALDHLISRYCSLNEPCENFDERFPLIQIMVMPDYASIRPLRNPPNASPKRKQRCKTIIN